MDPIRRPLAGLRILDMVAGPLAPATRYLAGLGATVTHVACDQYLPATRDGLRHFAANAGKAIVQVDAADDRVFDLFEHVDAVVLDSHHPLSRRADFAPDALRERFPDLLIITGSDFGMSNRCSNWTATDPVLHALTGQLARSGIKGRPPLLPPGELGLQCAATQFAWVILVALFQKLQGAAPEIVDFSMLEGAMHALDPGYGIGGSATMGRPAKLLSPDRPPRGFQYPIIACADGHVRLCVLAARQWRGMFEWMGRPAEFAAPEFEKTAIRYKSPTLLPAITEFFRDKTREQLEDGARAHGVPLSALLDGEEAIANEHFRERGTFRDVVAADGRKLSLPNGVLEIDGEHMVGTASGEPIAEAGSLALSPATAGLPLAGLKVLDLGVIVVGAEQGRLLADLGADVIKIESRAFPDGTRQSELSIGLSVSFAMGHRNKRSLGLNLRSGGGKALFEDLARQADVVLTNFKPGTMDALGLGYVHLAALNPDIILVESSAFGATGPWAERMGYGPLVRAATGLTRQWRYDDDPDSFSDSVTIYPDHVGGRITAIGVLALLIDRARAGRGGLIQSSQAEIVLAHQGWQIAATGIELDDPWQPDDAPWGVYPCAGEDDWCVVTVRNDADWRALCAVVAGLDPILDRAGRRSQRAAIEAALSGWLVNQSAESAMESLQGAGVPAAKMLRVAELPDFPAFAERGVFREVSHPYLNEPFHTGAHMALGANLAAPPERPAPLVGEQTADVVRDWLGLDDAAIAALINCGALEPLSEDIQAALATMNKD